MSRANPLTLAERRRALIEATRPLLLEYGPNITTRQIAECAGVAQGTIFRAFDTKQALIEAVVDDCFAPEPMIDAILAIPSEFNLADTVTRMVEILQARIRQVRSLMAAISPGLPHAGHPAPPHRDFHRPVEAALARTLARFDDQLTVAPATACWAISAMAFAAAMPLTQYPDTDDPRQFTRLILYGIAAPSAEDDPTC